MTTLHDLAEYLDKQKKPQLPIPGNGEEGKSSRYKLLESLPDAEEADEHTHETQPEMMFRALADMTPRERLNEYFSLGRLLEQKKTDENRLKIILATPKPEFAIGNGGELDRYKIKMTSDEDSLLQLQAEIRGIELRMSSLTTYIDLPSQKVPPDTFGNNDQDPQNLNLLAGEEGKSGATRSEHGSESRSIFRVYSEELDENPPLESKKGVNVFQKEITEQKTIADLFTLLASEKYKNQEFGHGTRKKSGVYLAERISEYILQAKAGDKVSPRFFIPDLIIAGKLEELLETSQTWQRTVDDYGIDVFERIESDDAIKDEQVGVAAKETIAKVQKETQPGLFEGVKSWFKRTDTILDKTIEGGLRHSKKVGFFAGLLLALGLWSASGDKNNKEGTESVNPDTISESREEEPFLGTNPAYNDGSSTETPEAQKEQARKAAAADAVKNAFASVGIHPDKVDLGDQDTKVFTGEEVVSPDGQDTVVNTESSQKKNLWDRIANPVDGMSDFRIANGNVYTIDPRQVRYVEAPTQNTYWAQAVVNDALNYSIQSRDGSIDVGKVNQWAKSPLWNVFDMYEKQNNEMKATGASYTDDELIFLRNTFMQLQKKIVEVGQKTNTLSPELSKINLAIQGIDLVLGSQQ